MIGWMGCLCSIGVRVTQYTDTQLYIGNHKISFAYTEIVAVKFNVHLIVML